MIKYKFTIPGISNVNCYLNKQYFIISEFVITRLQLHASFLLSIFLDFEYRYIKSDKC